MRRSFKEHMLFCANAMQLFQKCKLKLAEFGTWAEQFGLYCTITAGRKYSVYFSLPKKVLPGRIKWPNLKFLKLALPRVQFFMFNCLLITSFFDSIPHKMVPLIVTNMKSSVFKSICWYFYFYIESFEIVVYYLYLWFYLFTR